MSMQASRSDADKLHYNRNSKCETCLNYVRLTELERNTLQLKLQSLDHQKRKLLGACVRSRVSPKLAIRKYIFENQDNCELFVHGFFREKTGIACPACHTGEITLTRPTINGSLVILIGCSDYPKCRFSTRQMNLQTTCRYCGVNLTLTAGEIISCACPKCGRRVQAPIALKTWPYLLKPKGGCVHVQDDLLCEMCDRSRQERKSLIELELPTYLECEKQDALKKRKKDRPGAFEDWTEAGGYIDEDAQEALEDYLNYSDDIHTLLDEESDGDWLST